MCARWSTVDELSDVTARFDDLAAGSGFALSAPVEQFVAWTPAEVPGVLRAAEDAARRRWVAGFVSYEAAADDLPVRPWPREHPLGRLPSAWFAAFDRHTPVEAPGPAEAVGEWTTAASREWHHDAVEHIRSAIAAGEYYQVNLTTRLTGEVTDATALYAALASAQQGRHNALLVTPDHAVVSASPELFFARTGEEIVTRPMKGTAPRGRTEADDHAAARALRASAKERAENIMIVDLLRNDLSKIAVPGTVAVRSLLDVEAYPTVWQLTSTIAASIAPDVDLAATFGALFPCGSVTGAPKRAAMRAIVDLEDGPRGVYCGAIGYLRPHPVRPAARFSVAIRTVAVNRATGYAQYGTGGGITAGSDPAAEWAELLVKTAVLRSRQTQPH